MKEVREQIMNKKSIVFAGDRQIAVDILDFIHEGGTRVSGLYVATGKKASHSDVLIGRCPYLSPKEIFRGKAFREPEGIQFLNRLKPDYVIGIHFPYIVPPAVLMIPEIGVVNLHPAYLPFNRGWHTPSWAILDKTPIGATLHFMDEGIDTGDIIHQREVKVAANDTANTLYQKIMLSEFQVFKEGWPLLLQNSFIRIKQEGGKSTTHSMKDLFNENVQLLHMENETTIETLIDKLRALTTNNMSEAAYFNKNGKRYAVTLNITEVVTN